MKHFDFRGPDTYLPLKVCYEFLNQVKNREGIDSIAEEFYSGFKVSDLNIGNYLSSLPDLGTLIREGIKYDHLIATCTRMNLEINGPVAILKAFQVDEPSMGKDISLQINFSMIIKGFQYYLGENWTPLRINVTTSDGYWLSNYFRSRDYQVYANCSEMAIFFKTKDLYSKNHSNGNSSPPFNTPNTIESVTSRVLQSLENNYIPTLDQFSEYFDCSNRTVIRSLNCANTSYREVIEKLLFKRSLEILDDHTISVNEISNILGYSEPSNFIRAFKRWTSMTPNEYRLKAAIL